jgi:integrase
VSADLDELHARVERLEQSRSFGYRHHVAQRRRTVVELRSSGLSIGANRPADRHARRNRGVADSMSVRKRGDRWEVRYREGTRHRSRSFTLKGDADRFDREQHRRRELGTLPTLTAGRQTLDEYIEGTWALDYAARLAKNTQRDYTYLLDNEISPGLGHLPLGQVNTEAIRRWQSDLLTNGCPADRTGRALGLLGNIMQRAVEDGLVGTNQARLVRRPQVGEKSEVRPLAPETVERIRALLTPRDAMLVSLLAYAGPRPQEVVRLRWGHVRERTLVVHAPKTRRYRPKPRTVKLLAPLAQDLREWRLVCGRPGDDEPVIPAPRGGAWSDDGYYQWRSRVWKPTLVDARIPYRTPYALRHSFASLLLHEGRSVIYVARQLGHDATLTLKDYGHVIDELEGAPQVSADEAIRAARAALAEAAPVASRSS